MSNLTLVFLFVAYVAYKYVTMFPPNWLWRVWFGFTREQRRRAKFRSALVKTEDKIWEQEFLKHQVWEVRGDMREQHDWLRERVEGAIRRIAEIKYDLFYSETGDPVKVMDLPLPPREIETLPNKPTKPHRFHKVAKKDIDKSKLDELERVVKLREPDLQQQQQNLQGIDAKVKEIDAAVHGLFELKKSIHSMLRKL